MYVCGMESQAYARWLVKRQTEPTKERTKRFLYLSLLLLFSSFYFYVYIFSSSVLISICCCLLLSLLFFSMVRHMGGCLVDSASYNVHCTYSNIQDSLPLKYMYNTN